jgi:hypothetical protein
VIQGLIPDPRLLLAPNHWVFRFHGVLSLPAPASRVPRVIGTLAPTLALNFGHSSLRPGQKQPAFVKAITILRPTFSQPITRWFVSPASGPAPVLRPFKCQ